MGTIDRIAGIGDDMKAWRQDIHRHPEIAFEERRTADIVASRLGEWGIEVHRGLAGTGVVGVLKGRRENGPSIALRADMDALNLQELNDFAHRSVNDGKMHACGHDGHTTMLLGAARYLAETRAFDGTVVFIFQPAEENEGGGRVMIEDGLFEKFPVEAVYGMHNMPGLEAGHVAVRCGPMMASFDIFEITVSGVGSHAAMPHNGVDAIVIASQIVNALQTIVSRRTDPLLPSVVSITQFHAGETWNVLPEEAVLRGTIRTFSEELRASIEDDIRSIARGIASAQGGKAEVRVERRYPVLVNTAAETDLAAEAAAEVVGNAALHRNPDPLMGSEDFAFMLQEKPGCYIWLGNGRAGGPGGCAVHNPHYDFNDDVSVIGASYWARLVERALAL